MSTESTKTFKGRISNKHGTEADWYAAGTAAIPFCPLEGELIIYDPDDIYEHPRTKYGAKDAEDNLIPVHLLPWASGCNETVGLEFELSQDKSYFICSGIGLFRGGELIIPRGHCGLPVKEIGDHAFSEIGYDEDPQLQFSEITKVIIPYGIEIIGEWAFYLGYYFINGGITIPNSVHTLKEGVFWGAKCDYIYIPKSVITNDSYLFGDGMGVELKTVYCEYSENELPNTWHPSWNVENVPVVWGATKDVLKLNEKTIDKISSLELNTSDPAEVYSDELGISWKESSAIYLDNGKYAINFDTYNFAPIVAGENVTFEVDEENKVVKVNADVDTSNLATVDKISYINARYSDVTSVSIEDHGIDYDIDGEIQDVQHSNMADIGFKGNIPIVAGDNITFTVDEDNQVVKINATGGAVVQVEDYNNIPDDPSSLYRYNDSNLYEVVEKYNESSDGGHAYYKSSQRNSTSASVQAATLTTDFDSALSEFLTFTSGSELYPTYYEDIGFDAIRIGKSKGQGTLTINAKTSGIAVFHKYFSVTSGVPGSPDANSVVLLNGVEYNFVGEQDLEVPFEAGKQTFASYNGSSGRIFLKGFVFGDGETVEGFYTYTKHELARTSDITREITILEESIPTTAKSIHNELIKELVIPTVPFVGDVQIVDYTALPVASADKVKVIARQDKKLHQCVTSGDGELKDFKFAVTAKEGTAITAFGKDGIPYSQLGTNFDKYLTVSNLVKVAGHDGTGPIKLGSGTAIGSITFDKVVEGESIPADITEIKVSVRAYKDACKFRVGCGDVTVNKKVTNTVEDTVITLVPNDELVFDNTFIISTIAEETTEVDGEQQTVTYDKRGLVTGLKVVFGEIEYNWEPIVGSTDTEADSMIGLWVFNYTPNFDNVEYGTACNFKFQCNNREFSGITILNRNYGADGNFIQYDSVDSSLTVYSSVAVVWLTGGWDGDQYMEIEILEEPEEGWMKEWIKSNAKKKSSGLPSFDPEEDEGKFLRIQGGIAGWFSVPRATDYEF